jgi:hypothetical protein
MIRVTAVAIAIVAWSSVAHAQPAGAQAEVLFRQGRDLMDAGKITEACVAFEASQKLEPAVTTLMNLAGCREKLGQIATAWGLFLDAVRQTRSASDAASKKLHNVAQARAQKLEPRISKLAINVPLQSQFDGLEITRGTDRVEAGLWNRALPIDGGTYTVTARAPGSNPWSTQITVAAENDTKTVEIPDLRNLPRYFDKPVASARREQPAVASQAPAEDEPEDSAPAAPRRSSRVVPLAVGAGAVALLGGALGFELWARSRYDAAKSETMSQPRRDELYDSANTKRYVAQGLALGGIAAGGVAVWLYLHDRRRESRVSTEARVRVIPTASGFALLGRF